jgi:AraC-like DNA-binding protein
MIVWTEPYPTDEALLAPRAGYEVSLDADTTVHRPRGFGEYIVIVFTSAALLRTPRGVERIEPVAAVVHGPRSVQWYRGERRPLTHHWVHITGADAAGLIDSCGIALDAPFALLDPAAVTGVFSALITERYQRRGLWEQAVAGLCRVLLARLGRQRAAAATGDAAARGAGRSLDHIRARLRQRPQQRWTIEQLAREAGMSRTRFSVLYKQQFGAGAIDDCIGFRIQMAQSLLATTTLSIKEIAFRCGFEDPNYFSATFARRVGRSPTRYRER